MMNSLKTVLLIMRIQIPQRKNSLVLIQSLLIIKDRFLTLTAFHSKLIMEKQLIMELLLHYFARHVSKIVLPAQPTHFWFKIQGSIVMEAVHGYTYKNRIRIFVEVALRMIYLF